jgi:hypothetical protein
LVVSDDRMHRAASADGTEIADRVRGDGPPLDAHYRTARSHEAAVVAERVRR